VDKFRLKAEREEDDVELPELDDTLHQMVQRSKPKKMHLYCSHKEVNYRATWTASDVANKLDNGEPLLLGTRHHRRNAARRICSVAPVTCWADSNKDHTDDRAHACVAHSLFLGGFDAWTIS
jgi:hypothetical protein